MSDFMKAYRELIGHEGYEYSNDNDDKGGETFAGISRRWNPKWNGWIIIDAYKGMPNFEESVAGDASLKKLVYNYYKKHYWDVFRADDIIDDKVAYEIFECYVNIGEPVFEWVQISLNVTNRNERDYKDIDVDGVIGPVTIKTLNMATRKNSDRFLKVLNIFQGYHYISIWRNDPVQEKYVGWLNRVGL